MSDMFDKRPSAKRLEGGKPRAEDVPIQRLIEPSPKSDAAMLAASELAKSLTEKGYQLKSIDVTAGYGAKQFQGMLGLVVNLPNYEQEFSVIQTLRGMDQLTLASTAGLVSIFTWDIPKSPAQTLCIRVAYPDSTEDSKLNW